VHVSRYYVSIKKNITNLIKIVKQQIFGLALVLAQNVVAVKTMSLYGSWDQVRSKKLHLLTWSPGDYIFKHPVDLVNLMANHMINI
jgi:hypothetical protein